MRDTNGNNALTAQEQERAERAEMFSFHPDILREAGPLPRRADGSDYLEPAVGDESNGRRS